MAFGESGGRRGNWIKLLTRKWFNAIKYYFKKIILHIFSATNILIYSIFGRRFRKMFVIKFCPCWRQKYSELNRSNCYPKTEMIWLIEYFDLEWMRTLGKCLLKNPIQNLLNWTGFMLIFHIQST
jgi:hypothetical protein